MRKFIRPLTILIVFCSAALFSLAQNTTITGTVRNSLTKELLPAVSFIIKGTNEGGFTNEKGEFRITSSQKLPFVIQFTSIGYDAQELPGNSKC